MDDLNTFLKKAEGGSSVKPRENKSDLNSFLKEAERSVAPVEQQEDLNTFLKKAEGSISDQPYNTTVAPPEEKTPAPPEGKSYSANDLVLDEYFLPIRDYMVTRYGTHIKDLKRQDIVDKYLNNMRGFAGGNSVRAVSESVFLSQVDENSEDMQKVGRAYEIYEGMEGVFGDTTLGEKAGAVGDFIRTTVFDPVNLIGFGLAKTVTSSGFKAGSMTAQMAARQAYKKSIAKGATEEVAQKAANKIFKGRQMKLASEIAAKQAKREAVRQSVKGNVVKKFTNSEAVKEIVTIGAFDGAVAAATDYLYQDAMLRTKVQDEYNVYQTGLNAIAGMVLLGGMAAAGAGVTGLSRIVNPNQPIKTTTANAKLSDLSSTLDQMKTIGKEGKKVPEAGNWDFKVKAGTEL